MPQRSHPSTQGTRFSLRHLIHPSQSTIKLTRALRTLYFLTSSLIQKSRRLPVLAVNSLRHQNIIKRLIMAEPSAMALVGRLLPVAFCVLLFLAITAHQFYPSDDPYRCRALLGESERNGSWLHAPDIAGARKPFNNWQPDGCMLHHYQPDEIKECMGDRHAVFSGDSTTRQIFWGMARLVCLLLAIVLDVVLLLIKCSSWTVRRRRRDAMSSTLIEVTMPLLEVSECFIYGTLTTTLPSTKRSL